MEMPDEPDSKDTIAEIRSQFLECVSSREEGPGWLALVRKNALERFLDKGFPTTRDEDWRFTSVAAIASTSFGPPKEGDDEQARTLRKSLGLAELKRHELVFVNGRFSEVLSSVEDLPEGVAVTSLSRAIVEHPERIQPVLSTSDEAETAFFDWNEAFWGDGAFILLPKGVALEAPIHLVFLTLGAGGPSVSHPRNLILAEASSQARIIETYAGIDDAVYFTNAVTAVVADEGAVIDHYKIQRESVSAFHVASLDFVQGRSATVSDYSLSFGARLARNDIRAALDGEGADVTLNGLYVVKDRQHVDHHTVIDHRVAHCTSRELYKGVLDDAASGVFNGRVIVRPDAQKTDARQSNKNLLLSKDALVDTNPQLEINADDVKCAHGATIGQLDGEALFYLRSRGIALPEARRILTEGFMADVSDRVRVAAVREALRELLFSEAA